MEYHDEAVAWRDDEATAWHDFVKARLCAAGVPVRVRVGEAVRAELEAG